ncbi:hypothetical protein PVLB_27067 (plasmid) [Pseudomonas sp. VLB120]|nr:hypothetical protein PVLB_27067 [Pseudomonas sp. VLB120]
MIAPPRGDDQFNQPSNSELPILRAIAADRGIGLSSKPSHTVRIYSIGGSMFWDDEPLPEVPADILAQAAKGADSGDIGDRERSALQRVIAINQRLYRRAWELERKVEELESHGQSMRQQIVGLVQLTRRLGYEPSTKQPR